MAFETNERQALVRGLGLAAAISVIVGNVIGTGVFLKARVMTCNVGEPTWVILAWVAAGLLSLAGALTYAELTAMKPEAAGPYVFLRDSYGKLSSFLFGWMQLFIARTGSQASVAVVFAIALNDYLDGALKQTIFKTTIAGFAYEITSLQIIAVVVIAIFTTLNCLSVRLTGQIATVLTGVKIALILFVGLGAFFVRDRRQLLHIFHWRPPTAHAKASQTPCESASVQYSFSRWIWRRDARRAVGL
jgi:APA family basic amino acid/polyamine antiporter